MGFCLAIGTLQVTFASYDSTSQQTVFAPLRLLSLIAILRTIGRRNR